MATILEFKLAKKKNNVEVIDPVISSTINDMMLIIHHALHGDENDCRPKDLPLAVKLLDELSNHIKCGGAESYLVLSQSISELIVERYPEKVRESKVT